MAMTASATLLLVYSSIGADQELEVQKTWG